MGESEPDIEKLIYNDLNKLAEKKGLKDPEFSLSKLIQAGILPGTYEQQVRAYRALIVKNLPLVDSEDNREALYVKLNLREGYPDSGSMDRLAMFGEGQGRRVARTDRGQRRNKRSGDMASAAQKQLARLICRDIAWHNECGDWDRLLGDTSGPSPFNERLEDSAADLVGELFQAPGVESDKESDDIQSTERQPLPIRKPHYVHRPRLEAQFMEAVDGGTERIVFYGQAGMGKTTLAAELTRDTATGKPAPLIRVNHGKVSDVHVQEAYSALNIPEPHSEDPATRLAALVCSQDAPPFVVLDNLDSSDELHELLPRNAKSTIVATCRLQGNKLTADARYIPVGKMERGEAIQLLCKYSEMLEYWEAVSVASQLGDYPLLLAYMSAICQEQSKQIADFCREVATDVVTLAQGAYTEDDLTLLAMVQWMTSEVAARDPLAYELLVCCSFLGGPPLLYTPFLIRYLSAISGSQVTQLRFAQAVRVLQGFGLLEAPYPQVWQMATIHPFTVEQLRAKFKDKLPEIADLFRDITSMRGDDIDSVLEAIRCKREGTFFLMLPDCGGKALVITLSQGKGYRQITVMDAHLGDPSSWQPTGYVTDPDTYDGVHLVFVEIFDEESADSEILGMAHRAINMRIKGSPLDSKRVDVQLVFIIRPEGGMSEEEEKAAIGNAFYVACGKTPT